MLFFIKLLSNKIKNALKKKGYKFNSNYSVIGRVDAIHIDKNKMFYGGADKRGDDKSIGY